ncbi:ribonuclease Z [Phocicoccus pinnipedialis]|uniref:Ribonuclease Z n=1 Tax=Phocicoccus pinnipedialis TaxID=110845 RepID=A0A6V7RDF5_9BACL|nr:ribonuclease Z [Jeotgalicoccus pinnipedialis]MBP1939337.1 ribonuclease Z [Jeotgalicoccus pinnipedialis]CAD2075804.1 Ribonuclease Z [Jeotgalicoccus pinnipedialis]
MRLTVLGSGAGLPSKERKTQSIILDLIPEINAYFLIDVGEALQHQLLHTNIKSRKINHIFITHLHGDHIYGLPGFLSSRAFQGGENQPLHIYGPKGIEEWLEVTFQISGTHLNYPFYVHEIHDGMTLSVEGYQVDVRLLDHPIDSYLFVFKEPDKEGSLDADKLKEVGIRPGPIYAEIKESNTFEHDGITYNTSEFLGPVTPGKKIAIHGDTRLIKDSEYKRLIENSDVVIHEATFLDNESEKAHEFGHSEIHEVMELFKSLNIDTTIFTHISNRYDENFLNNIKQKLPEQTYIAEDFFSFQVK